MVSRIFGLLALVAVAASSPISDVGGRLVNLLSGGPEVDSRDAAALLRSRFELLSALAFSGKDADLIDAFAASSFLGPSLRNRIKGLGLGALLEQRTCCQARAPPCGASTTHPRAMFPCRR